MNPQRANKIRQMVWDLLPDSNKAQIWSAGLAIFLGVLCGPSYGLVTFAVLGLLAIVHEFHFNMFTRDNMAFHDEVRRLLD